MFRILHRGHVTYLTFARNQGDALVVAVNTDQSVKANKGDDRPINNEEDRAYVLASLRAVDYMVYFGDPEPKGIIAEILPQVLVKERLGALRQRPGSGGGQRRTGGAGRHGGGPVNYKGIEKIVKVYGKAEAKRG